MQPIPKFYAASIAVLVMALCACPGPSLAATTVTIVAIVTDGYQLVDDLGQPYEVENTTKGNELVLNHVGSKVEVTGTVQDEVDYKIIVVESFRVIEE